MCLATSNNLLLVLQDAPKHIFSMNLQSSGQPKNDAKTLFFTLHPLSTVIFATATVLTFVLRHDSRFSFHSYTQREATPTQKSAWKCTATSRDFLHKRLQSAFNLASLNRPIVFKTKSQTFQPDHFQKLSLNLNSTSSQHSCDGSNSSTRRHAS